MRWELFFTGAVCLAVTAADFIPDEISTCFSDEDCRVFGDDDATCVNEFRVSWCKCGDRYHYFTEEGTTNNIRICYPKDTDLISETAKQFTLSLSLRFLGLSCDNMNQLTESYSAFASSTLAGVLSSSHACATDGVLTTTVLNTTLSGMFDSSLITYPTAIKQFIATNSLAGFGGSTIAFERLSFLRADLLWCPATDASLSRSYFGEGLSPICGDTVCNTGYGFNQAGYCTIGIHDPSSLRVCNTDYDCTLHGDTDATCSRTGTQARCLCSLGYSNYLGLSTSRTSTSTFYSCFSSSESSNVIATTEQKYVLSITLVDVICDIDGDMTNLFNKQFEQLVHSLFEKEMEIKHFCESVNGRTSSHNVHIAVIATGTVATVFDIIFATLGSLITNGPARVYSPKSVRYQVSALQASGYGCTYFSGVSLTVAFEGFSTCRAFNCLDGFDYNVIGTCTGTPAPAVSVDDELTSGSIAGIVLGCVAGLIILSAIIYFFCIYKEVPSDPPNGPDGPGPV